MKRRSFVKLDYDQILENDSLNEIPLVGGENTTEFKKSESGTLIRLSRLSFDALKSKPKTVIRELSEHFEFIDPNDFMMVMNGHRIPRPGRRFAFSWPDPDTPKNKLIEHSLQTDHGEIKFEYRLRFRQDRKSLPAQKRGVRVYTHNRMASSPSLFEADTNMHGFRMTDYLDGVVRADFIDDQKRDYIATDRQSLTWETPLLSPLKEFLSEQIKEACKEYQKVRDAGKKNEVLQDEFTADVLGSQPLSAREKTVARRLAVNLASISKKGVDDEKYKQLLPDFMLAFGQGSLYEKLSELADNEHPNIQELVTEVVKLNRLELDRSTSIVKSRLKAIDALEKEVLKTPNDDGGRNESAIQNLFEEAPWLIDPIYHDYLSADKSLNTTLKNLAKELGITDPITSDIVQDVSNREPDFAFLIGDDPLHYVVIVELKASNKKAEIGDLMQLRRYMDTASTWLVENGHNVAVRGELVCTPPPHQSRKREYHDFRIEAKKLKVGDDHRIRSYTSVLEETKKAHQNILEIANTLTTTVLNEDIES